MRWACVGHLQGGGVKRGGARVRRVGVRFLVWWHARAAWGWLCEVEFAVHRRSC